jgi:hypothetical protein
MEELLQRCSSRALYLRECRPLFDEITEQRCINIIAPVQDLRIVLFYGVSEPIGDAYTVIHDLSPLLNQRHQRTHLNALRFERLKMAGMIQHEIQCQLSIRGIVFGTAGAEGLSTLRQCDRVDRINHEEIISL